jgi:hypothetical protein
LNIQTHAHKYKKMGGVAIFIVASQKYFSGEKFSDHGSDRRLPPLRSGTHLNSLVKNQPLTD